MTNGQLMVNIQQTST